MRYRHVCIESLGYTLPPLAVATSQLEQRLAPLYERLRLPAGRLELMSGIRQRRFWPPGTRISDLSIQSGRRAITASGLEPACIGALVHGSVCRDFLEPATASRVHHELQLSARCAVYDVSNACLGLLNGMLQVADMIELGHIDAGLVVGSEDGRQLVENTVRSLNEDLSVTRTSIKSSIASLTIGSASAAVLLCHERLSRAKSRLHGGVLRANTRQHELCCSDGHETIMHTDSERLLQQGVATGAETFGHFLGELQWQRSRIDRVICHQVGAAHRKLLLETLELDAALDFSTLELLGNTGAAALPVTLALAIQQHRLTPGDCVALLGIGSGIHCAMLGLEFQGCRVEGECCGDFNEQLEATPAAVRSSSERRLPRAGAKSDLARRAAARP